ncbi:MAG: HipA N-terminal domain-containing protein [Chitinophagaceae bacterium]|nr:HipA N-terminal domain-containing protein [Chitinophagaceae bacterium]
MRSAKILYNGQLAGILSKSGKLYRFVYDKQYLLKAGTRPISVTLPKREEPYESNILFPALVNRLSEGANKALQNRVLKIDEYDYFSLLLATAETETIGPLTVKEIYES